MSPIDEQLRTTLRQRADDVVSQGDPFAAIEHRARGIHRRRVAVGAAGALAVIAAAAVAIPAATGAFQASHSGYTNNQDINNQTPPPPDYTVVIGWRQAYGGAPIGAGPVVAPGLAAPDFTGSYPQSWGAVTAYELLWVGPKQNDGSIPMLGVAKTDDGHIVAAGVVRPNNSADRVYSVHDIARTATEISVVLPYRQYGSVVVITEPSIINTESIRYRTSSTSPWVPVEANEGALITPGSAMFPRQGIGGDEIQVLGGSKVVYQGPIAKGVTYSQAMSAPAPVARDIQVYADCTSPSFEPTAIRFACADNGDGVMNLQWTSWTPTSATALGTYWLKDCKPNCAQGGISYTSGERITLSDPQRDANGHLVWTKLTMTPHPAWWDTGPLHGFVTLPTHQI